MAIISKLRFPTQRRWLQDVLEKTGPVVPVAERKRPEEPAMLSSMSESNVPAPPVSDAYEIAKAGGKHSNWSLYRTKILTN